MGNELLNSTRASRHGRKHDSYALYLKIQSLKANQERLVRAMECLLESKPETSLENILTNGDRRYHARAVLDSLETEHAS